MPPPRMIDASTAEKFSTLVAICIDNGLSLTLDLLGPTASSKTSGIFWIAQIFDEKENLVVSGRGKAPPEAVRELYDRWFQKTPKSFKA